MTIAPLSLHQLFKQSARTDGFRFLNINDLIDAQCLEFDSKLVSTSPSIPEVFVSDPFAQIAFLKDQITHRIVPAHQKLNWFESKKSSELYQVRIQENAELEYVLFQHGVSNLGGDHPFPRLHIVAEKNSRLKLTIVQSANQKSQIRCQIDCVGEGAQVEVRGLTLGKLKERQDLWIDVQHKVPHTKSKVTAWCVVNDQAHSVFNGTMTIDQTAPFTEAYQKNKNLILSDQASVDAFPKLLIANDEVKCSHGSSVSSLEPEQLIYLQSRGIDRTQAEEMILRGFVHQALEWIESRETQNKIETILLGADEFGEAIQS